MPCPSVRRAVTPAMPPRVKTCSGASLTPLRKNVRLVSRVTWAMVSTLTIVAPGGVSARVPLEAMCAARSAVVDSSRLVPLRPRLPGLDCWPLRDPASSLVVAWRSDAVVGSLLVDSTLSARVLSVDGIRLTHSRCKRFVPALLWAVPIGVISRGYSTYRRDETRSRPRRGQRADGSAPEGGADDAKRRARQRHGQEQREQGREQRQRQKTAAQSSRASREAIVQKKKRTRGKRTKRSPTTERGGRESSRKRVRIHACAASDG